jgi:hypothetical protein
MRSLFRVVHAEEGDLGASRVRRPPVNFQLPRGAGLGCPCGRDSRGALRKRSPFVDAIAKREKPIR